MVIAIGLAVKYRIPINQVDVEEEVFTIDMKVPKFVKKALETII